MRTLYLDCSMGAAGDMLTAALLELTSNPEEMLCRINDLGIPGTVTSREDAAKCGIHGTHIRVTVNGEEEGAETHHHEHGEEHHHHTGMNQVEHIVHHMKVSSKVQEDILAVYGLIAEAESAAHGVPVTEIHFHEVGNLDAIADVAAVCLLMEELSPDQVVVSPVHVGSGQVRCAHGILPVPAPATAYILKGVPIYGGEIRGELCTPTGAALLKHFASRFGAMPVMRTEKIGYGMGQKDFEAANCVRALLGETGEQKDTVVELSCNMDDITAEMTGFAMERFFEAGALEVYTIPIGMKKSRPGLLLCVMCREDKKEEMIRLIFHHTTTIGIRESVSHRYTLNRRICTIETPEGEVRRKESSGYDVTRIKYEYEDLARIAKKKGISITEAAKLADHCQEHPLDGQ